MSLKRKTKASEGFSMASMTDVIFLLLIFFLVASTVIIPNAIKVSLPSAQQQPTLDNPPSIRVVISSEGRFYLGLEDEQELEMNLEDIEHQLTLFATKSPTAYVAVHADESVPYSKVVQAINLASRSNLKVVLATKVTNQ